MTNERLKAARILAVLAKSHRRVVFLEVDDVLDKCTEKELDFYYFWIVQGGKKNV